MHSTQSPRAQSPLMWLRLQLYPYRRHFKWLRRVAQWQMQLSIRETLQWRFCRWVSLLTTDPDERILWQMPGTKLKFTLDPLETIQMYLYYRKGFQPEIGRWVRAGLQPDALFIDAGANIGIQSLIAADFFRAKLGASALPLVYAFEPNPRILEQLQENIRLNDLQDFVCALPYAVSDRRATTQFFLSSQDNSASSSLAALGPGHLHTGQTVEVQTLTLADFVRDIANNRRVGLLKLDIEGAELLALRGAKTLLARDHPTIIMEVYPALLRAFGYAYADICAFLKAHDYTIQRVMPDGALRTLPNDEWPADVAYGDIICFHTSKKSSE